MYFLQLKDLYGDNVPTGDDFQYGLEKIDQNITLITLIRYASTTSIEIKTTAEEKTVLKVNVDTYLTGTNNGINKIRNINNSTVVGVDNVSVNSKIETRKRVASDIDTNKNGA